MQDFSSPTTYESTSVYCRDAHWASEKPSYSINVGGRPMVVPTIPHKGYANHFHTNRPLIESFNIHYFLLCLYTPIGLPSLFPAPSTTQSSALGAI